MLHAVNSSDLAAQQVNHSESLADALQGMLDMVGRQSGAVSPEDFLAIDKALEAITLYRGNNEQNASITRKRQEAD